MRIIRLDLTRYGIFTDYAISFGEQKGGGSDLHIIYGPNEAGKSTTLSAFLDLLFGIEIRSRYGFIHPYSTMRIGGELEINGISREFVRIKRAQNSLLDGGDKPISDGIIQGGLGGIDRASYTTMFSLDDASLEAGGESILESKGDLGQLLFSASAVLSELSRKLVDLRAEAEGFYKFRARGGELSELKTRLAHLKDERERIDTIASEYARLVETRDSTATQYDEAIAERGRIQSRLEALRRQLGVLPRLVALRGLRERIKPLLEIPDTPIGWVEDFPKLQKEEIELATRTNGIELEIRNISAELDEIVVDDQVLDFAERVALLADLRARYVTADKDIPERSLEQRDADLAISGILARMECDPDTDPGSLLLGASTTGSLRELMEQRSGIEAGMETAEEELTEARRRLFEAQAKLKEAGGDTQSENASTVTQLASVLSLARADDHATRHRLAGRSRLEQLDKLAEHMHTLSPWTGEANELHDISPPDAGDIERWKSSVAEAEKCVERHEEEIERLLADQRRLMAEIEVASQVAGVVSDQEAANIRAVREDAWAGHKRTLDEVSAEAFEVSLRHDDIVTNSRIGNAAEVANLNQVSKRLASVNADLSAARDGRNVASMELEVIQGEIAAAIRAMAPELPENWSLPKLEAWLERRNKALESLAAVKKADHDVREAEQDGEKIRRKLIDAASTTSIDFEADVSTDTLISVLQTVIDRETELRTLRSEEAERKRDVDARERRVKMVKGTEQAWDESWTRLCTNCWLGEDGSIPTVPATREVLKALDELGPLIERRASLADRIQKMESDQRRFSTEVGELAKALEMDVTAPPIDLAVQITKAVEKARASEAAREAALNRLKDAETRKQNISEIKEIHDRRKTDMIDHFKVDSLGEVDTKLRDLERRHELQDQAATAEQDVLDALGVASIDMAEEILDNLDRNVVEIEIAQLEGRFEDQDKHSHELFSECSKASDRLEAVGGDDAVARIDERRRTTLLEIEDGAERYLRLRLGVVAAEQALRIYRDQHRSSMMSRAAEAFKTISRDAYKGLTTQPDKDSEVLVAVGANDSSKIASELSKGTRFQLYLALRVAGYQEFAQSRQPVPFIADDIMETFDDFRAEEAFKLLAEMAKVGQVIYLTHHRHLVDIARTVCPDVRVHELSNN